MVAIPRGVGHELSARIASNTPVDEGVLRDSWTPSVGAPVFDNSGGSALAVLRGMQPGQVYYYANGQPYAPRIEYESWSPQAPGGMVSVAVAEAQQITDEIIGGLKRGI